MSEKRDIKTSVGQVVSKMTATIDGVVIPIVPLEVAAYKMGYSIRHVQNMCSWHQLIAIKISGLWFVHEMELDTYRQNVRGKAVG